jgi:hypothetical protein
MRDRDGQFQPHDSLGQQPQGPPPLSGRGRAARFGNQTGFLLAVELMGLSRTRSLLQGALQPNQSNEFMKILYLDCFSRIAGSLSYDARSARINLET